MLIYTMINFYRTDYYCVKSVFYQFRLSIYSFLACKFFPSIVRSIYVFSTMHMPQITFLIDLQH